MNKRLKEIRTFEKLSMEKFGERIGIGKSAISRMESGVSNITDQTIKSICREFDISEEWLRSGNPPMHKQKEDKFSVYLRQIEDGNDDFIKDLIEVYMELDQASREDLRKIAMAMAEKQQTRETISPPPKTLDPKTATKEEKMEAYQEYLDEKEKKRREAN